MLAPGCRSLSERTYVTEGSSVDEVVKQKDDARKAGAATMLGQLLTFLVNGDPGRPD